MDAIMDVLEDVKMVAMDHVWELAIGVVQTDVREDAIGIAMVHVVVVA